MKLKTFLIINAVVSGVSALAFILFSEKANTLYGVESNPASLFMRLYGALGSIVTANVTWFARNVEDKKAQRAILLGLLRSESSATRISSSMSYFDFPMWLYRFSKIVHFKQELVMFGLGILADKDIKYFNFF